MGGRAEIDDGQTAMPKANMILYKDALAIRPSMRQGLGHPSDRAFVDRRVRVTIDFAADAAHDALRLAGVLENLQELGKIRLDRVALLYDGPTAAPHGLAEIAIPDQQREFLDPFRR